MRSARERTMPLVANNTKLMLKNNELALGFGVHHLRTGATAMLAAAAAKGCGNGRPTAAGGGGAGRWTGPPDLTAERGIPGQIDPRRVVEAYEKVAAAGRASGKALGMGGVYDKETASRYIKAGARMVLSCSDHTYVLAAEASQSARRHRGK